MSTRVWWAGPLLLGGALVVAGAGCSDREEPGSSTDGSIGFDVTPPECERDLDCGDRIACTIDHCEDGVCTHEPCADCCPEDLACAPDLGCRTAPEPCTDDSECNDDVPCTLDRCRDATFCEHLPQDELCGGGMSCLSALGCIPSPPETCETAEDCTGGNVCLGEWVCEPEFGCQFVSPADCDDGDECTDDACGLDEGACSHTVRDRDGDGYGDAECGADDCNDEADVVHPDAEETCNGVDDDCDEAVDESCCTAGDPCTTSCGSMGTTTCNPDGTAGPCMPPEEACNGVDDDCDGDPDEGFDCRAGASGSCTTACGTTGSRMCTDACAFDACVPPMETCNGMDDDCDGDPDDGFGCVAGDSASCTTICGSTGSRECLGDCTWDSCVPPMETCNGVDDDCDAAPDDGFDCVRGSTTTCTTSCGSTGTRTCGSSCTYGACDPPAEGCTGMDDDCDGDVDETSECSPGATTTCTTSCGSTGIRTCGSGCSYGACEPPSEACNGSDDDCDGACDDGFSCCAGTTRDCSTLGFASGTATCMGDCSGFDTSTCSMCGNGSIDSGEDCDGSDLGGEDCTTVPGSFTGGTLGCTGSCTFDTSMCTTFDPSGIYDVSPHPTYMCASGLVDYDYGTFTFTDDGTTLTVDGARCRMTGPSARSTRMFSVSCTITGGCDETYTLTGTFTTDDEWMGTMMVGFSPLYPGACADCVDQSHSVTGTRR